MLPVGCSFPDERNTETAERNTEAIVSIVKTGEVSRKKLRMRSSLLLCNQHQLIEEE